MYPFLKYVCVTIVCEPLLPPADGTIITSSDSKTVTYSCNSGYTLNGDAVRVCRMDGTAWNGTDPTCGEHLIYIYNLF